MGWKRRFGFALAGGGARGPAVSILSIVNSSWGWRAKGAAFEVRDVRVIPFAASASGHTHADVVPTPPPATPVGFLFRELASQIRPFRGIESHPAKGSLIQPPFLPLFTRCFLLPFLLLAFLLSFFFFCSAFFLSGILLPRPRFFLGGVFACARSTLEKQLQQSALFDESERSKRSFFNDSSFIRCYLPLWL